MKNAMFDLTDDVENSPETTIKAKPVEVSTIEDKFKMVKDKQEQPDVKKETPKNDDFNEYDYSDDKELDDANW